MQEEKRCEAETGKHKMVSSDRKPSDRKPSIFTCLGKDEEEGAHKYPHKGEKMGEGDQLMLSGSFKLTVAHVPVSHAPVWEHYCCILVAELRMH